MPDFDIDFCQERREEVIAYVQAKYGRDRVAQIITFGTLQARAVLRDVGPGDAAAAGPRRPAGQDGPQQPGQPDHAGQGDRDRAAPAAGAGDRRRASPRLLEVALQLEGLYRNASTHAAGIVIGDRPLTELVPLYRDPHSDIPATQFNMKWVESAGLGEVRLPGPEDADRHRPRGEAPGPPRRRHRPRATAARRCGDLRPHRLRPDDRRVPDGRAGHARHPAQAPPLVDRRHHRADLALSARPDGLDRRLRRPQVGAQRRRRPAPALGRRCWPRPTASSSTRSR